MYLNWSKTCPKPKSEIIPKVNTKWRKYLIRSSWWQIIVCSLIFHNLNFLIYWNYQKLNKFACKNACKWTFNCLIRKICEYNQIGPCQDFIATFVQTSNSNWSKIGSVKLKIVTYGLFRMGLQKMNIFRAYKHFHTSFSLQIIGTDFIIHLF